MLALFSSLFVLVELGFWVGGKLLDFNEENELQKIEGIRKRDRLGRMCFEIGD